MRRAFIAFSFFALWIMASVSFAQSQYVEEIATLEGVYENRARSVLNTFLRPNEYTVIVSAQMNQDKIKLDEYREDLEMLFIPGLPIPGDSSLQPANNLLHEMKSNVEIYVVLNTDVPPEKELLIGNVLRSKLHLDELSGDKIQIDRAQFPVDQHKKTPDILPEFSWKMWALVALIALLALAGIIYLLNKKKASDEAKKQMEREHYQDLPRFDQKQKDEPKDENQDEESVAEKLKAKGEKDSDMILWGRINQMKEDFTSLSVEMPHLTTKILGEYINRGNEGPVTYTFELIGWDTARQMYKHLSPRIWGRVGAEVRKRVAEPSLEEYEKNINQVYRYVLSKVLEDGTHGDKKNPFNFLFDQPRDDRRELLKGESPANLALIGLSCSAEQVSDLLEAFSDDLKEDFIIATAKLKSLPDSAIQASAKALFKKLKQLEHTKEVVADGPKLAVKFLRSLTPEKEYELFNKMIKNHSSEAQDLRRMGVQFIDIPMYPEEIVREVLGPLEVEVISTSLFQGDPKVVTRILDLLPPKKAKMVSSDLEFGYKKPRVREVAEAQRVIVNRIEDMFERMGIQVEDLWENKMSQAA